ncbi:Dual specificity protein phosphatase 23 [Holothuria leucospilota]|uniref:Dual specificity protein phosphatase 23 n=1 Tax=Holothuria leucospilota TaxID=206669 RepID=A0A9Q1H4Q6_HOLLE|nr:Dual specificity protein phosphatase 23 [Holothuria leucospilota]
MPATTPPPFFSWVVPNKLAAHGLPSSASEVQYLEEVGIKHVAVLMKERQPPVEEAPSINWSFIGIEDFTAPTIQQVQDFLDVVKKGIDQNEAVSVHCFRGRGRTGTMLACYFVKFENLSADEAIKKVRDLRPGSIETKDQEDLVGDFYEYCKTEKAEEKD